MKASHGVTAHFVATLLAGLLSAQPASAALLGKTLGIATQFPNVGEVCCGSIDVVVGTGLVLMQPIVSSSTSG